jgi:hypothetical protein
MPYTPKEIELLDWQKKVEALDRRNYLREVRRLAINGVDIPDATLAAEGTTMEINNNFTDDQGRLVFFQDPDTKEVIKNVEFDNYKVGERTKRLVVRYKENISYTDYEEVEGYEKESFKELVQLKSEWI